MNTLEFVRFRPLDYACREAINTLCTNLTLLDSSKRIIMITSPQAHEGKSFLSMNIMRTLAQLGKKVVLVDADLRRSQISTRYGMRVLEGSGYGFSHYLAGMCSMDDVVYETNIPGAYMVPVGREVGNSLALLGSGRLGELLEDLEIRYDFVLVDAPPVGVIIDAAEIAKSCRGTIFAVKYNAVSRSDLADAKEQIERTGCAVLGAVLNDVNMNPFGRSGNNNGNEYDYYDFDDRRPGEARRKASGEERRKASAERNTAAQRKAPNAGRPAAQRSRTTAGNKKVYKK